MAVCTVEGFMKKTRILLSGKARIENYIKAVEAVGAEAVAEALPKIDTGYDGLILCGGADMDPRYYGEENCGSVNIDAERDENEMALMRAYVSAGKPILGICRGHQLINVFFGGSLYQDIPERDLHGRGEMGDGRHEVKALSDSVLGSLYGESFFVNSAHHQAIKELGDGIRATAWWADKYVEAIEHMTLPIIGVQWHPERMCLDEKRGDTISGLAMFECFVELCKAFSGDKE